MENRTKEIRHLSIAAILLLVFASVGLAQNMTFTGTFNGLTYVVGGEDVYVSPYTGTINGNSVLMICDDFNTEVTSSWTATASNAASLDGTEKFYSTFGDGTTDSNPQLEYNAAAYLANELFGILNYGNPSATPANQQIDLSVAIWDLFDPSLKSVGTGQAMNDMNAALAAVAGGPVYSNITVYTPAPNGSSQEFLVISTPEASLPATLAVELSALVGVVFLMRRRLLRAGTPR